MANIVKQEWYRHLLEDLRKLEFTGIVLTKWNIGKRILEDFEKFGRPEYGGKRIENIAKDLKGSVQDVYYCLQFAKKYPKIPTALESSSWRNVVSDLPENQESRLINSPPKLLKEAMEDRVKKLSPKKYDL